MIFNTVKYTVLILRYHLTPGRNFIFLIFINDKIGSFRHQSCTLFKTLMRHGLFVNNINPHHIKRTTKEISEKPDISHFNSAYLEGEEKQHDGIANCQVEWNKLERNIFSLIEHLPD